MKYTQMGFDLLTFSGGRAPSRTAVVRLLLVERTLIEAAKKNNRQTPITVGRGMKVAKEEMLACRRRRLVFEQDDARTRRRKYRRRADVIVKQLNSIPTLQTTNLCS